MNYGEIRTQFKAILNRRDCTNALADTFLNQSLERCSRELSLTGQEAQYQITVGSTFSGLTLPSNVNQIIGVMTNLTDTQQRKVENRSLARLLEIDRVGQGNPQFYARVGNTLQFRPTPAEGVVITLYYYGDFPQFSGDTSETFLSVIASDLLIYGALSYAADYFMDDRGQAFEARYNQIAQALQDQAYDLEAHDAQVAPAYNLKY